MTASVTLRIYSFTVGFQGRPVMSCCGARNLLLADRSQDFDRCHSFLLASSAPGGARKRPRFGNPPYCSHMAEKSRPRRRSQTSPVAVPEILCSLSAHRISTAATPFCSLLPPPAALANVPASVTLRRCLFFIPYRPRAVNVKRRARRDQNSLSTRSVCPGLSPSSTRLTFGCAA